MKSFEISIVCAQGRLRLRAVSSEKLDCSWRVCIANSVVSAANEVLVERTALFSCCFQNSKFDLNIKFRNAQTIKSIQTRSFAFGRIKLSAIFVCRRSFYQVELRPFIFCSLYGIVFSVIIFFIIDLFNNEVIEQV